MCCHVFLWGLLRECVRNASDRTESVRSCPVQSLDLPGAGGRSLVLRRTPGAPNGNDSHLRVILSFQGLHGLHPLETTRLRCPFCDDLMGHPPQQVIDSTRTTRPVSRSPGYLDLFDFRRSGMDWAPGNLKEEQILVAQGDRTMPAGPAGKLIVDGYW